MLDEPARVSGTTRLASQAVLERGQWTDPARELDEGSPDCRRNVEVRHSWPPQDRKATEHDEQNEDEMQADHDIGEESVQCLLPRCPAAPLSRHFACPLPDPPHRIHRWKVLRDGLPAVALIDRRP